jgi:hypothetical protein
MAIGVILRAAGLFAAGLSIRLSLLALECAEALLDDDGL